MSSTSETAELSGSAERWGPLWGARPMDWALSEDQQTPTYEEALRHVSLNRVSSSSTSAVAWAHSCAWLPTAARERSGSMRPKP